MPTTAEELKALGWERPDVNADIASLIGAEMEYDWVEPLHSHHKWQRQLIELCGIVCADIKANT